MFDQMDKGSEIEEMKISSSSAITAVACDVSSSSGSEGQLIKKACSDCGTSKTPLWRGGPAGPKSLCNACGIRSRKRRRALLGLNKPEEKRSKKTTSSNKGSISSESGGGSSDGEQKLRSLLKLTGLTWQRSTAEKHRRILGEEEQAAVLLMAMAYSSVFG